MSACTGGSGEERTGHSALIALPLFLSLTLHAAALYLSLAMQHTHGPQEGIMEVVLISEDMRQEQEGMEQKKMSTMPASKHQGSGNKAPSPFLHKGLPVRTPEPGEKAMPMQEERVFSLTDTMNKDRTPHAASPPSSVQETNVEEHEMDAGGDDGTEHGGERKVGHLVYRETLMARAAQVSLMPSSAPETALHSCTKKCRSIPLSQKK